MKGIFYKGTAEIGSRLIYFLFFAFAARQLGTDAFGEWSVAISFAAMCSVAMDGGLNTQVTSLYGLQDKKKQADIYSLRISLILIVCLLGIILAKLTSSDTSTLLICMLIQFGVVSFADLIIAKSDGLKLIQTGAIIRLTYRLIISVSGSLFLIFSKSIHYFAYINIISASVLLVWIIYYGRQKNLVKKPVFNLDDNLGILWESRSLIGAALVTALYFKSDGIILNLLGTQKKDIGLFSASFRVIEMTNMVPSTIALTALPFFASQIQEKRDELLKILTDIMLVLGAIFSLNIICFSDIIIKILYGSEFERSSFYLSLLSMSGIFIFQNYIFSIFYTASQKSQVIFKGALIAAFTGLSTRLILIKNIGVLGVIWGFISAEIALFFYYRIYNKKIFNYNNKRLFFTLFSIFINTIVILYKKTNDISIKNQFLLYLFLTTLIIVFSHLIGFIKISDISKNFSKKKKQNEY